MPDRPRQLDVSNWAEIIRATKTTIGFFSLIVLAVVVTLGVLIFTANDVIQMVATYGIIGIFVLLIVVVTIFAKTGPEDLFKTVVGRTNRAEEFCNKFAGCWWETITPSEPSALSFISVRPHPATGTVRMLGRAYSKDGKISVNWESVACCVNPDENKIFYYWTGIHPSTPGERHEGFGEISLYESSSGINRGDGIFSNTNLTEVASVTKRSVRLSRCTEKEVAVMRSDDSKQVTELVLTKLGSSESRDSVLV